MGLFSAISSIFTGNSQAKAIKQANAAEQAAIQKAQQGITNQQNTNTQAFSPYTSAGAGATSSLEDMLGLNGSDKQAAAIEALKSSPAFTSQYNTGVNTLEQNASATGGLRGGDTNLGLAQFGANLLGNVQQQDISNLFGLSNQGLAATSNLTGANDSLSALIANLFDKSGQANASSITGQAQAKNGIINNIGGFLDAAPNTGSTNGSNLINMITSLF